MEKTSLSDLSFSHWSRGRAEGRPHSLAAKPHASSRSFPKGSKTGVPRPQLSMVGLRSEGRGRGVQARLGRNEVPFHKHRGDDWILSVAPTAGSPQALRHPPRGREAPHPCTRGRAATG